MAKTKKTNARRVQQAQIRAGLIMAGRRFKSWDELNRNLRPSPPPTHGVSMPFTVTHGDSQTKASGKRRQFASGSVRDSRQGKGRYDLIPALAMRRLAELYERGAEHYGDNNWKK